MLASLKKRTEREDEGFTLIELMVVVLIIAILLAIAIPTFLGARERAQDRAAQSDIRNALTAEKVYYTDNQVYTAGSTGVVAIKSIEPSLTYTPGNGSKTAVGLITSNEANGPVQICIDKISAGGTTFSLIDVASGAGAGTYFGKIACAASGAPHASATAPGSYKTGGW